MTKKIYNHPEVQVTSLGMTASLLVGSANDGSMSVHTDKTTNEVW